MKKRLLSLKELKEKRVREDLREAVKIEMERIRKEIQYCLEKLGKKDKMSGLIDKADFCLYRALQRG